MKPVKCVVWDLDGTLWPGTLLEGDALAPDPAVVEVIRELDRRGILHSIASRNEPEQALARLREHGLADLFLFPQIGWDAKHASVRTIAERLNIGLDALAFVDDQPFDRDEVRFELPAVRTYAPEEVAGFCALPEFTPPAVTEEASRRRELYAAEQLRATAEQEWEGPAPEFLASLEMILTIAPATEADLDRAEELTVRTNQLNTTGRTYSREQLAALARSPEHELLVASLEDRYGSYGKIGLALIERGQAAWTLKLLLMSCRVMSRGVGSVLINHVRDMAAAAGARLLCELIPTDRNRMMLITLRLGGFREAGERDGARLLESPPGDVPPPPDHLTLRLEAPAGLRPPSPA